MHLALAFAILFQSLFGVDAVPWAGNVPPPAGTQAAISDPKTGIIYYVESDLRDVAAISPKGKILWVCEVIKPNEKRRDWISSIDLGQPGHSYQSIGGSGMEEEKGEDCIVISIWREGFESATIDKKTGKVKFSGQVT